MLKAYDTILQSEVAANLAAQSRGFEPYRYECACCGEEVYVAAADSANIVPHFRHRIYNNDVECENYLGQHGLISIDSHSRKSNRERAEFYFEKSSMTFSIGLRFTADEIMTYEQENSRFEMKLSDEEQPFFSILINNTNFAPDVSMLIPITKFSYSYFFSNSLNKTNRIYDFLKSGNMPTFFKLYSGDRNYKAKLVSGVELYTDIPYFVAFQSQYTTPHNPHFPEEIVVDDAFSFETMGRKFLGIILTITKKTAQMDTLSSSWGYQLEASETLTLLWPPASLIDDVYSIGSDNAYLYSSFALQAHGNINVHSGDVIQVANGISRVSVKKKTKIYKKNAEITIDKNEQQFSGFENIFTAESSADTYIVLDEDTYQFSRSGVKKLSKGQFVSLTPKNEIRRYFSGYLVDRIHPRRKEELTGESLLNDILAHYRRIEVLNKGTFNSLSLSETATRYIRKCEALGLINTKVKQFIEEGWL